MSNKFNEALRHLGHIYKRRLDDMDIQNRVRHIGKVYVPTGNIGPICGSEIGEGQLLGCPSLWLDSNCDECREIEGLGFGAITKRSLLLGLVNEICNFEQIFLDAMYWNYHNPNEEPINPDPDGQLAEGWLMFQRQIVSMTERFKPTMAKHEDRFAWPTDLEEGE